MAASRIKEQKAANSREITRPQFISFRSRRRGFNRRYPLYPKTKTTIRLPHPRLTRRLSDQADNNVPPVRLNIDKRVINDVSDKLEQRFDQCLKKLKDDYTAGKLSKVASSGEEPSKSILSVFEENIGDNEELKSILEQVRITIDEKGLDENNFEQIYQEMARRAIVQGCGLTNSGGSPTQK